MIDVRFSTALQLMLGLVLAEKEGVAFVSSSRLATGVGANPTLIRRMLAMLAQADLVSTAMGKNGGVKLARTAGSIRLSEIYTAATAGKTLIAARTDYEHRCLVSMNFASYFGRLTAELEDTMLGFLGAKTLADSFDELEPVASKRIADDEADPAACAARSGTSTPPR